MIDTFRGQVSGVEGWSDLLAAVQQEFSGATLTQGNYAPGMPWQAATWKDDRLGTMGCKSNRTGSFLWVETSLGKFLNEDNNSLLSVHDALEGIDGLCGAVERKYRDFIPSPKDGRRSLWKCTRADLYHQREVPSVPAVCVALADTFGNKSRLAKYLTSIEYMQSRDYRARWYGKGDESGDETYANVLRHEEQIRGYSRAGFFVDVPAMSLRPAEARVYMNKRYEGWPDEGVEVADIAALVEQHGSAGLAASAFVLLPSLEATAKQHLSKDAFYKYRRLATEYRKRKVNVDLRVPENAWSK